MGDQTDADDETIARAVARYSAADDDDRAVLISIGPLTRGGAFLLDLIVYACGAVVFTFLTLVAYIIVTGDDFDGPPSYEATGDWFVMFIMTLGFVLCTAAEAVWGQSVGKRVFRLRVVPDADRSPPLPQRVRRWAVKWLPATTLLVFALFAYVRLEANRDDYDLERMGRFHETMLLAAPFVPCAVLIVQLVYLAADRRRTLHDRLAGTGVMQISPDYASRAFAPIVSHRKDLP